MTSKQLMHHIGNTDDQYILEAGESGIGRGKKTVKLRRVLILAAVITALLALSATAVAGNWFGLGELLLGRNGDTASDVISLEGFLETPEYLASQEWQAFLASYDTDGKILEEMGNDIYRPGTSYNFYTVYSQEMADKLDEIVEKYGLKLHTSMLTDLYTKETLIAQVGGNFLGENRSYTAYMYEDGTFHFDGETDLAYYGLLDYQFDRCVRGSFTGATLHIGNAADYTQWTYTTQDGITLTLALSPYKALILADLGDSLVTVNVLAGSETEADAVFSSGPITAEDLERFAGSFRFSALTPALPADPSLPRPDFGLGTDETPDQPSAEDFYNATGLALDDAQRFYAEFVGEIEADDRAAVAEKILYPAMVTVNGAEIGVENASQFLGFYDDIFTDELWENIMVTRYDMERADLFWNAGLVGAAGGCIWFAPVEDGIRVFTVQNSTAAVRPRYSGIAAGELYNTREEAYVAVLEDLLYRNILPDGTVCESGGLMESNHFVVADVTGDRKEELILLYTDTYTAGQMGYILSYDEDSGERSMLFTAYPMFAFYEGGYLRAYASHNQGAAGDALWPYTLYRYDVSSHCYRTIARVDAWSKELTEIYQGEAFPTEVDREGTGVVYFVMEDGAYDTSSPMSQGEYNEWLSTNVGQSKEREMEYMNLTEENIALLRE